MQSNAPVTPEEIITLILEEMRAEIAPVYYTNLVRSVYQVYLYVEDLERLQPVLSRVRDEAIRALNDELGKLNRQAHPKLKVPMLTGRRKAKQYETLGDWVVEFHENTDEDAKENPLVVYSSFGAASAADDRAGTMTERVTKRQSGGTVTTTTRSAASSETSRAGGVAYATIEYEDDRGAHTYRMVKDQIKIGRGASDRWVDLKVATKKDISREHVEIRRDDRGRFFIKDLSSLGTTVNGKRVPPGIERVNGQEIDRNVESPLPNKARIGLAGVLFLEFRAE